MARLQWPWRWSSVENKEHPNEAETLSLEGKESQTLENAKDTVTGSTEPSNSGSEEKSPSEESSGAEFFDELAHRLQSPEFLERLRDADKSSPSDVQPSTSLEKETEEDDSEEEFVLVTKEDALEGLVETIAQCILACPEAQQVRPHELQDAITAACKDLKKTKAKTTWGWLKFIYRAASWSYSAFSFYTNPWIVRAILTALWSMPKLLARFLF